MNQSRNLYSPAVAGYTDEKSMMPYFEELVAAFVDIEQKGYCTVDGIHYPIYGIMLFSSVYPATAGEYILRD